MIAKPIIFNGRDFVNDTQSGIHRNALELVKAIDGIAQDWEIELVVPYVNSNVPSFENIKVVDITEMENPFINCLGWGSVRFPRYVEKRGGVGVDMTLSAPARGNQCVFDYDCIKELNAEIYFPGLHGWLERKRWEIRCKKALDNALVVFTDSEYAKNEIATYYKCDPEKIKVIYCAWQHVLNIEQDDTALARLGLEDGKYFFSLGSRYPHKNFHWVECAAKQNPGYTFVVTGTDMRTDKTSTGNQADNIMYTGYLTDEEVKALQMHCRAFLHPSFHEGFGIPPMEAMSVGAKCIVSNATALPEVYGDSVWYIDPNNYDDIDLERIMSKPLHEDAGTLLGRYSWTKSAEALLTAIEERC